MGYTKTKQTVILYGSLVFDKKRNGSTGPFQLFPGDGAQPFAYPPRHVESRKLGSFAECLFLGFL